MRYLRVHACIHTCTHQRMRTSSSGVRARVRAREGAHQPACRGQLQASHRILLCALASDTIGASSTLAILARRTTSLSPASDRGIRRRRSKARDARDASACASLMAMRILYDGADVLAEPTCHAYMQARSSRRVLLCFVRFESCVAWWRPWDGR